MSKGRRNIVVLTLVAVVAGAGMLLFSRTASDDPVDDGAVEGIAASPGAAAQEPGSEEEVDPGYSSATDELQTAYEERKVELPPEVAEPLARDLNMIESAISEIGAALVNDPENESLKQMLVATYRNQIKVLKQALKIAGDDPEDYVAE